MMRGLRPLVGLAAALWASSARAQPASDDGWDERPCCAAPADAGRPCCAAPADAGRPCCAARVAAAVAPPSRALLTRVAVGGAYRRAFGDDFAGGAVEVELGGRTPVFSIGTRLDAVFGATRGRLHYQTVTLGPAFMFRVGDRLQLGVGATIGVVTVQRVSATAASDPEMWGITAGSYGEASWDLVRTRSGGAWFVAARVGADYVQAADFDLLAGASASLRAWVGYRD